MYWAILVASLRYQGCRNLRKHGHTGLISSTSVQIKNTHSLYHFENSAIVDSHNEWNYHFYPCQINVTSGFNLRRMKKNPRMELISWRIKTTLKTLISPLLMCPQGSQGSQGCQKMRQDLSNWDLEVWCANMESKLHKIWKTVRKHVFLMFFS